VRELRQIAEVYLDDELNFSELKTATLAFKRYLQELTPLDLANDVYRTDIHLEAGLAIATEWAVRCVDDLERTKTFIKGTAQAIEDVLHRRAGPVHLLYAGTGPFATLVLPLLSVFTPDQLQLTLIEINDQSYQSILHIFNQPAFAPYAREILQGDASILQLAQPKTYDILLSETMQNTLKREPQVPITVNLLRQIRSDALLVPQRIVVKLAAMDVKYWEGIWIQKPIPLGILMESSREALAEQLKSSGSKMMFPEVMLEITSEALEGKSTLALTTEIHVFGTQHLRFDKSGLTIPDHILSLDDCKDTDLIFKARYELHPEPGIVWSV
jgi:predicted RNA methylase